MRALASDMGGVRAGASAGQGFLWDGVLPPKKCLVFATAMPFWMRTASQRYITVGRQKMDTLKQFLRDRCGATAVQYCLIAAAIAIGTIVGVHSLLGQ
jgi:Flp/Fap pilin component